MKQNNYSFLQCKLRSWWLLVLLMLFMGSGVAQAVDYVTLNTGAGYTHSYLVSNCTGKHVTVNGTGTVTLNVSGELNIKELFAPTATVNIVLSNSAMFRIEQDADNENAAVNCKNITITNSSGASQGHVIVTAPHTGIAIQEGGKVQVNYLSLLSVTSHTASAVIAQNNSVLEVNNGLLSLKGATHAFRPWDKNFVTGIFTVKGSYSNVEVRGSIGGDCTIQSFNVEGCSYMNIIGNNRETAVHAHDVNITGGKVYVTQTGGTPQYTDAHGLFATENATISYCQLEANSAAGHAIRVQGPLVINNANVRAIGGKNGVMTWSAQLLGNAENSNVLAVGNEYGFYSQSTIDIASHSLIGRGATSGVTASVINVTPQPGCSYQAYGTYPFLALKQYNLSPAINLLRPTRIIGSLSTSNTNYKFEGGSAINYNIPSVSSDPCKVFARPNGTTLYSGLVELKQPHIYNISGNDAYGDFGLLKSGQTQITSPGKTETFDFSALNPYLTYNNPTKTVKLYKKQHNGDSNEQILVQEWVGTTMNSLSRTFYDNDVEYLFWCEVSLDAYEGYLETSHYLVRKGANAATPVKPILILSNNTIRVTNGRADQEYAVVPQSQWSAYLSDITSPGQSLETWWVNSVKPTANGAVSLTGLGTQGVVNHVITRYKETAGMLAGSIHRNSEIFYGSSVQVRGAELELTAVGNNFVNPDFENTYSTKLNGVIKVEAKPVPANATNYQGVLGSSWGCTYMQDGVLPFKFYANAACTTPLDNNTLYTTVYAKANREGYKWSLFADVYSEDPENDNIATSKVEVNISDANGVFRPYKLIVNHGEDLTTHSTTVTGIPFEIVPANATFDGDVTVNLVTAIGPFPSWAQQTNRIPTFVVDKTNRTIDMIPNTQPMLYDHNYRFTVRHMVNGTTYGSGGLSVQVVRAPLSSFNISPAQATLNLGQSLPLEITSDLPEAWREYENPTMASSNEQVATVTYDNSLRTFVVTATDDPAMIGKSATITITINGIEETCQVTVGGEVYPITIAGTKVNSVNQDDVLGDGKVRYAAGTLYLNGVQAVMGSQDALRFTASETLPVLNIDVEGENMLHSNNGVGISLQGDAIVSGSGTLIGSGAIYGLLGSSANLTVTGDALVHTVANSIGMRIGSLYVNSKNAQVKTNGFNNSSLLVVNKDMWGNITEPAGAYLDADGYVSLGGNVVKNQYVVINGMAGQSVVPGDVNGDGECTGSDVTALYNHILFGEDTPIFNGDQNGDGEVTGSDVTAVYNIILGL